MNQPIVTIRWSNRAALVRSGRRLEVLTIAYNSLEGLLAILLGLLAGSITLVGFGFDSAIEVTSGAALVWRLGADADEARRERAEALSLRVVGWCFLALAAYVAYDSVTTLLRREAPEESIPGPPLILRSGQRRRTSSPK